MSVTVDLSGLRAVEKMRGDILEEAAMRAEFEIRRYVPMDEGVLRASEQIASQFRAGLLVWATPTPPTEYYLPHAHDGRHHRPLGRGVGARQAAAVDGLRGGHLRREDAMSARIDAVDVAQRRPGGDAGQAGVLSVADSYRRRSPPVLTCGMPVQTAVLGRQRHRDASPDRDREAHVRGGGHRRRRRRLPLALNKAGALESRDGSYRLVSNSAETPASSDGTSRGAGCGPSTRKSSTKR